MAKSFEDNITRLEEIVSQLERGDAKLADSLKLFEEGTKLVTSCGKMLDEAEQKVVRLTKGADGRSKPPLLRRNSTWNENCLPSAWRNAARWSRTFSMHNASPRTSPTRGCSTPCVTVSPRAASACGRS